MGEDDQHNSGYQLASSEQHNDGQHPPHDDHDKPDGPVHAQKIDVTGMEDTPLDDDNPKPAEHIESQDNISPREPSPASPKQSVTDDDQFPASIAIQPSSDVSQPTSPLPASDETRPPIASRTISEGFSRKVTGTLSWFSRNQKATVKPDGSPARKASSSFPQFGARRTTSSAHPIGAIRDEVSPHRGGSLQDRFQALRMEDERKDHVAADGVVTPGTEVSPQLPDTDDDPKSPMSDDQSNPRTKQASTVTSKLPPGTAAGVSMGPSTEDDGPVNWDLWQNLVNEGPAAMNKTSGEELNAAIQSGIPSTVRGVVWQVLADSKSEHLELVYNSLLGRDAPVVSSTRSVSRGNSVVQTNGEKESITSSASSIHSHTSTAATSANAMSPQSPAVANDDIDTQQETYVKHVRKKSVDNSIAIQRLEKTIRKDLGARTAYSKYLASSGLQEGLFGVCKAYALYDEAIGYAQGMNFIAMPLLFNMPEEEAFTLFVKLMSKYDMRSMFTPEMTGLHLRLYQFERLLEDFEPALYCHLHRRGVHPMLYATQWFLTLFAYRFPLQLVQRIYDLVLSEGMSALLKFGIVLMQKNSAILLGMKDMSQLSTYLKEKLFDVYIDKSPSASSILDSGFFGLAGGVDKEIYHADALVRDACAIDVSSQTLAQYQTEFEEKARQEKDREAELESLRTSNSTLAAKLRNLESRVQQQDNDHVGLASDLIRTKVDNEALADANESLKVQVEELRKVVENQPGEVEERLKDEMERIMARNIEVQNSNRALEDSMQEMEQEMVATKMQFAQLNAEYEDLRQKLSNIQNLLGGGAAAIAAASPGPQ